MCSKRIFVLVYVKYTVSHSVCVPNTNIASLCTYLTLFIVMNHPYVCIHDGSAFYDKVIHLYTSLVKHNMKDNYGHVPQCVSVT